MQPQQKMCPAVVLVQRVCIRAVLPPPSPGSEQKYDAKAILITCPGKGGIVFLQGRDKMHCWGPFFGWISGLDVLCNDVSFLPPSLQFCLQLIRSFGGEGAFGICKHWEEENGGYALNQRLRGEDHNRFWATTFLDLTCTDLTNLCKMQRRNSAVPSPEWSLQFLSILGLKKKKHHKSQCSLPAVQFSMSVPFPGEAAMNGTLTKCWWYLLSIMGLSGGCFFSG